MRSRATFTISLPPAVAEELEKARKLEHRSRSELIREALRFYLLPVAKPTARDLRGIQKGRAEIRRGDYVTLDQLHAELDRLDLLKRPQKHPARTSARARTTPRRARPSGRRSPRR
ncbi:MAG: ribbon-helix-helix protein, CopG family [Deltaproteobacteria bacterium]|nr:MAG: ribbon-helix-helix protein, CopG family [Deltaproteobacteria bacterium]